MPGAQCFENRFFAGPATEEDLAKLSSVSPGAGQHVRSVSTGWKNRRAICSS